MTLVIEGAFNNNSTLTLGDLLDKGEGDFAADMMLLVEGGKVQERRIEASTKLLRENSFTAHRRTEN